VTYITCKHLYRITHQKSAIPLISFEQFRNSKLWCGFLNTRIIKGNSFIIVNKHKTKHFTFNWTHTSNSASTKQTGTVLS